MISGKQILWGTLGWAFGGPIGGILGVIFAGSGEHGSYKSIKQSQAGDFMVSLLVLFAKVMKADGKLLKSELEYVKSFLKRNLSSKQSTVFIKMFQEILRNPSKKAFKKPKISPCNRHAYPALGKRNPQRSHPKTPHWRDAGDSGAAKARSRQLLLGAPCGQRVLKPRELLTWRIRLRGSGPFSIFSRDCPSICSARRPVARFFERWKNGFATSRRCVMDTDKPTLH